MEYDEIDQYVDQLFREKDPPTREDIRSTLWIASNGQPSLSEDYRVEYNHLNSNDTQTSLRSLTCAEWILIAAIGVGLLLFMMLKA